MSAHLDGHVILPWGAGWGIDAAGIGGKWRALRLDGSGDLLTAATAEDLNAMIRVETEQAVAAR